MDSATAPTTDRLERSELIERLAAGDDPLVQALVDQAGLGVAVIDAGRRMVRANAWLGRIALLAEMPCPGSMFIDLFDPDCCADVETYIDGVLGGIIGLEPIAGRFRARSSSSLELRATAVFGSDGAVSGAICHIIEGQTQARLARSLASGQRLQAVGQFTAGIVHDFNNLLMTVIAAADDIVLRGSLDKASLRDVRHIQSSGRRGAALVRQLLSYGRPQPAEPQYLCVNDAIDSISPLLQRLAGPSVSVEAAVTPFGLPVRLDPTQLDQVFMNLVVNAAKAMPDGGRLELRTGRITLETPMPWGQALLAPGRYVTIDVEDTGIGIPADILPRIFDPFFTTRAATGGTGLGLSTVHSVVWSCKGALTVNSVVGEGTCFRLYLPAADPPSDDRPATAASLPATAPCAIGGTILIVEDEEGICRFSRRVLEGQGWEVVCAASAEEALDRIDADPALLARLDLVLCDIALPGHHGGLLMAAVAERRPGVPALYASGFSQASLVHQGVPMSAFLAKPYTARELISATAGYRPTHRGAA